MRSVMHIFKKKKEEAKKKRILLNNNISNTIKNLLEDENEDSESFTLDKTLIIEAWSKYRPSSKENSPRENQAVISPKKRDIQDIYGEAFLSRLLAGIKQKKYRGKDERAAATEDEKLKQHLTSLLVNGGKQLQNIDVDEDEDEKKIPEEEIQLIEDFLDKFVFITDSTTSKEQIDLNLALKALPIKVEEHNIYRIDLINFNLI